jgi:Fe-S cluster biogenesis protein NfuA
MEAKIKELLEALRVNLQNDGGDLELVKIEGNNVFLKLKGACGTCPHAQMTLKQGIERILREQISKDITVERVM